MLVIVGQEWFAVLDCGYYPAQVAEVHAVVGHQIEEGSIGFGVASGIINENIELHWSALVQRGSFDVEPGEGECPL